MSTAAHMAAMMQAVKASGAIVRLEPTAFERLAGKAEDPLVVVRHGDGMFGERWEYLMGYKGLAFYAKSKTRLNLPGRAEVIEAKSLWMPA